MAAVTVSLCSTLLLVGVSVFVSAEQKNITADPGEDVTLTCRAPNNNILVVKWSRADLGSEYVLFYRDGHFVPDNQHPSFKNRVDLQDRHMKDGDVSVILKDVMTADEGTYECHVFMEGPRSLKPISIINLSVPPEQKTITAESGQNVTLTCQAANNNIRAVEWSRADLESEYVLLYRNGQFDPGNQHPAFKNRVDLQDRQMKDGDVSVILKDVTVNDEGTYECRVAQRNSEPLNPISIIYLRVVAPPGPGGGTTEGGVSRGHPGLIVGLSVAALLIVVVVVVVVFFLMYRKQKPSLYPGQHPGNETSSDHKYDSGHLQTEQTRSSLFRHQTSRF